MSGLSLSRCNQRFFLPLIYCIPSAANLPSDCINLGQGYMNFPPPAWVTDAANTALKDVLANHYSHPKGRIRLRNSIKAFYENSFNRSLDVETEILVTSGANEGHSSFIFLTYFGSCSPKASIPFLLRFWITGTKLSCSNLSSTSISPP